MASPLDLQEQEQLDALKVFWKTWGNLITWALVAVLVAFAGYNAWQWWQRDQAAKAGAMFAQLEAAAQGLDAQRSGQIFADLKERYPKTVYAEQGALLAARVQFERGQVDAAKASLQWAADNAIEEEVRTVARFRLAGLLLQSKDYDGALKQLESAKSATFAALVADRRGDVYLAMGKPAEARSAYQAAWTLMESRVEYRQLIDAKLTALGAPPAAASAPEATK